MPGPLRAPARPPGPARCTAPADAHTGRRAPRPCERRRAATACPRSSFARIPPGPRDTRDTGDRRPVSRRRSRARSDPHTILRSPPRLRSDPAGPRASARGADSRPTWPPSPARSRRPKRRARAEPRRARTASPAAHARETGTPGGARPSAPGRGCPSALRRAAPPRATPSSGRRWRTDRRARGAAGSRTPVRGRPRPRPRPWARATPPREAPPATFRSNARRGPVVDEHAAPIVEMDVDLARAGGTLHHARAEGGMLDAISSHIVLGDAVVAHRSREIGSHRRFARCGCGAARPRLRLGLDAARARIPGRADARLRVEARPTVGVAPARVALELEREVAHADARLLLELAGETLHLLDPRRAALRLALAAELPVARAPEQEEIGGRVGHLALGARRELRRQRALVGHRDRGVRQALEQRAQRRLARAHARAGRRDEPHHHECEPVARADADQIDPIDAEVRVLRAELRVGRCGLEHHAGVQRLEEALVLGKPQRCPALLATCDEREGRVLAVALRMAFRRETLVRLHQVLLVRVAAAGCAVTLRLELGRQGGARELGRRLAEAPCLTHARIASPLDERMTCHAGSPFPSRNHKGSPTPVHERRHEALDPAATRERRDRRARSRALSLRAGAERMRAHGGRARAARPGRIPARAAALLARDARARDARACEPRVRGGCEGRGGRGLLPREREPAGREAPGTGRAQPAGAVGGSQPGALRAAEVARHARGGGGAEARRARPRAGWPRGAADPGATLARPRGPRRGARRVPAARGRALTKRPAARPAFPGRRARHPAGEAGRTARRGSTPGELPARFGRPAP